MNEFQFIVFSHDKIFIYGCEPSPLYALQQLSSVFTESLQFDSSTVTGQNSFPDGSDRGNPVDVQASVTSATATASHTGSYYTGEDLDSNTRSVTDTHSQSQSQTQSQSQSQLLSLSPSQNPSQVLNLQEMTDEDDENSEEGIKPGEYFYWSEFDVISILDLAAFYPSKITGLKKLSAESTKIIVCFDNGIVRLLAYDLSVLPGVQSMETQKRHHPPKELYSFTGHFGNRCVKEMVICNSSTTDKHASI